MNTTSATGSTTGGLDPERIATRHDFAAALTRVREGAGLTVREVARATGINASTVGGYFSGRHLPPLRPDGGVRVILRACGVTDPAALDAWHRALARIRRAPGPRPVGPPSPWVGLRALGFADADRLHGRETELRALTRLVDRGGPVAVVGDAGSGKSSLLCAGLLPRLAALRPGRPLTMFTPGSHPVRALAQALAELIDTDPQEALAALHAAPAGARALAAAARPDPAHPRPVIVVDQFEELFTHCADEREQDVLVAALAAVCRPTRDGEPGPAAVVLGLRSRFVPRAGRYPDLARALRPSGRGGSTVTLRPLTADGLRAAVLGPARSVGLEVDPAFLDRLLTEVASAPAPVMPRVAHALATAWRSGQRARLTPADVARFGGFTGSVEGAAEAAYLALPESARRAARTLLTGLHVVTPGGVLPAASAVPAQRRDLRPVPASAGPAPGDGPARPAPGPDAATDAAARALIDAGLLTRDDGTLRAASGCLPDLWGRLRDWLPEPGPTAATPAPRVPTPRPVHPTPHELPAGAVPGGGRSPGNARVTGGWAVVAAAVALLVLAGVAARVVWGQ